MYDVGILTFHCADNFGAMLQAYGLKTYLRKKSINADIISYEPPFMTGRHWWIPYIPGSIHDIVRNAWYGWRNNLRMGWTFFECRARMKRFRKEYLLTHSVKKIYFTGQLKKLPYRYYIVGSDQIWNPDITFGLRKVYFGAFENDCKKKVIAYAASIGKTSLASNFDLEFSKLIKSVDCISVRERTAISYISQFCKEDIWAVPDPVFLLKDKEWQKIEKVPEKEGYIFVYMTEDNNDLINYARELSKQKGLMIFKVKGGPDFDDVNILTDYVAGPAEFLGYIHKADYVVTNSFHGVAFSIIFQKKFVAFQHSSVGERISNVLTLHRLEDRMYQKDRYIEIDRDIAWEEVRRHTKENVKVAEDFLLNNLCEI